VRKENLEKSFAGVSEGSSIRGARGEGGSNEPPDGEIAALRPSPTQSWGQEREYPDMERRKWPGKDRDKKDGGQKKKRIFNQEEVDRKDRDHQ